VDAIGPERAFCAAFTKNLNLIFKVGATTLSYGCANLRREQMWR
jgi:hypothetical protein